MVSRSQGSRLQRDTFLLLIDTDTPRTEYMHLFHPLPTNEEERDTAKMVPSGAAITATSSMDPGKDEIMKAQTNFIHDKS